MNPLLQFLSDLALFLGVVFGLGLPLAASWPLPAAEKICGGAALGLIILYVAGLLIYWTNLPVSAHWVLPAAAAALTGARWRACRVLWQDPAARSLLGSYLLVAGWSLGLLALVRSYSGARWALDWLDHYDRARFFLWHWPVHQPLSCGDLLPARPPLANIVTAGFLALAGAGFPNFQIFTTLASSLAFLPGWLFALKFGRGSAAAPALFTVLYLLNPSLMENSTFAWTKLLAVFFVLTGLYFFLPVLNGGSRPRIAAAFALLAAGFLAHYSAGPYLIALVAAYGWSRRRQWLLRTFWTEAIVCALPAAALLALWFGWSGLTYGVGDTLLSNTSVTESGVRSVPEFFREKGLNLYQTLVPHPFRGTDYHFFAQSSTLGRWRDYFFLLYQVNLPLLFGSMGSVALGWLLWRSARNPAPVDPGQASRAFWWWFLGSTIILGTAANGGVDQWGVAHLCLLSLLGLGLAFLSAGIGGLPRGWQIGVAAGVALDFVLGVVLQFFLENLSFPADWLQDGGRMVISTHGGGTWTNLDLKLLSGFAFAGDWPISRPLLLLLLGGLLALALVRWRQASRVDGKFPP